MSVRNGVQLPPVRLDRNRYKVAYIPVMTKMHGAMIQVGLKRVEVTRPYERKSPRTTQDRAMVTQAAEKRHRKNQKRLNHALRSGQKVVISS